MSNKVQVLTFGCRLNTYESDIMQSLAEKGDYDDVIIVNTCAVTSEAERQVRQAIRRAHRENPQASILVTGCASQIRPDEFLKMPGVVKVIGNQEKMKQAPFFKETQSSLLGDLREHPHRTLDDLPLRTPSQVKPRRFLQIQNGCNHSCTFCTIPLGRGKNQSFTPEHILKQVKLFVEGGCQELILTGVDITDYGKDLFPQVSLGVLCDQILNNEPDLKRLRLSSLDPSELEPRLCHLFREEPRLMPHVHLSLQAGDDLILKRMRRRHLRHHVYSLCHTLRDIRSDIVFGADVIAGFPTETEDMFHNTVELLETCQINLLHIFPYSPRPGTPAARMPQVDKALRKERAKTLISQGQRRLKGYLDSKVGDVVEVLMENEGQGYTPHFIKVKTSVSQDKVGKVLPLKVLRAEEGTLVGSEA